MILTPALLVSLAVGIFMLGQIFYPDPVAPEPIFVTPTPGFEEEIDPAPRVPIVLQKIDTVKLNTGLQANAPAFDWPEVDNLKLQPNPGRPGEQADYVPELAAIEMRRLIAASTVGVVLHTSPVIAQGAVEELAKSYPLRQAKQPVLDFEVTTGYAPDDSAYGVVFTLANYRVHIETVVTSPPVRPSQRAAVEFETLHLADHIARRLQEISSSGKRTGPEATAVHWRDHLARTLPFAR